MTIILIRQYSLEVMGIDLGSYDYPDVRVGMANLLMIARLCLIFLTAGMYASGFYIMMVQVLYWVAAMGSVDTDSLPGYNPKHRK
jgi:hypothetical protein